MNKKTLALGVVVLLILLAFVSLFFYFNQIKEKEKIRQEYQSIIQISENAIDIDYNTFIDKVYSGRVFSDSIKSQSENENVKLVIKRYNIDKQLYEAIGERNDGTYFKVFFGDSKEWETLSPWLYGYRVPTRTTSSADLETEGISAKAQEITYMTLVDLVQAGFKGAQLSGKNKNINWVIRQTNPIDFSTEDVLGEFTDGTYFKTHLRVGTKESSNFNDLMYDYKISARSLPIIPKIHWTERLYLWIPTILLVIVIGFGTWWILARGPLAGTFKGFGKKEKRKAGERPKERFSDVAGIDEIIKEVNFIVKFFKKPGILRRLSGKPFKAILLSGPPGCGKTLLAKAIAGEAGVNFFSISGSEFVEMFVGVGAMRVRDLFKTAKKNTPAIILIDEADSLGKRGSDTGDSGGQEYRQTLNQILAEMDGFDPLVGIFVIFATNFPDLLDPALRRKGRINREINIPLPSLEGRKEILNIHLKDQITAGVLADNVDINALALKTYNFSGADLANLVNETIFIAVRKEKEKIDKSDFDEAFEIILLGLAGKPVGDPDEKRKTAIHEAGHVLLSRLQPTMKKLKMQVASILRRSESMGIVQLIQEGDIRSFSQKELEARICFCLGGRAAERVVYDELSSGASSDLKNATKIVRAMVRQYGMSTLGPMVLEEQGGLQQKNISQDTIRDFELAEREILRQCEQNTEELLQQNRKILEILAEALIIKEELREQEIQTIIETPVS